MTTGVKEWVLNSDPMYGKSDHGSKWPDLGVWPPNMPQFPMSIGPQGWFLAS